MALDSQSMFGQLESPAMLIIFSSAIRAISLNCSYYRQVKGALPDPGAR